MPLESRTRSRIDRAALKAFIGSTVLLCCLLHGVPGRSACAETLLLEDGSRIEGAIVAATGTTIGVKLIPGGLRQLRRRDLAEVGLTLAGRTVSTASWSTAELSRCVTAGRPKAKPSGAPER